MYCNKNLGQDTLLCILYTIHSFGNYVKFKTKNDDFLCSYPDYEIVGDISIAKSAAVNSRYSENSLSGIITDIHLLSLTDYLVCTFSSQVQYLIILF